MIQLYTVQEFVDTKSRQKLLLQCEECDDAFLLTKHQILCALNENNKIKGRFCSRKCFTLYYSRKNTILLKCTECKKEFTKVKSQANRSKNHFCSKSCAATYNNKHKTKGTRRSKLETWIEEQLSTIYPNLHIDFNKKDAINAELDIYIPSISLAFELNGIFHYEPIYGQKKLSQIQNNDQRKHQACLEAGIEICWIDTSSQKYFKPKTAQKFLDIITPIIKNKLKER